METLTELVSKFHSATSVEEQMAIAEKIAERISPPIHNFVLSRVPESDVDDVVQEVLVAITHGLEGFSVESDQKFWALCYKIAHHKIVNKYRTPKTECLPNEEDLHAAIEASGRNQPISAAERAMLNEAMGMVKKAKPPCFEYLRLRFIYGLGLQEMAEMFNMTYDAMRIAVSRCIELAQGLAGEE